MQQAAASDPWATAGSRAQRAGTPARSSGSGTGRRRGLLQDFSALNTVDPDYCFSAYLPDGSYPYPGACDRFVICSGYLTGVFLCAQCMPASNPLCAGQEYMWYSWEKRLCDW